jgi:hypothetical protein
MDEDKHYDALPTEHILRKAADQWSDMQDGEENKWTLPPLCKAPPGFRDDNRHIYMQERFLAKTWNTTPHALMTAGVNFRVS